MARKFTGGKWRHQQAHGRHWVQAGKHEVCQVSAIEKKKGDEVDEDEAETAANAALLADAPELLAQLAALVHACGAERGSGYPAMEGKEVRAAARLVKKHLGAPAAAGPGAQP
jgi:hypothetical protein